MIITSSPPRWRCLAGNAQLFITNPNPETAFFHKKRQTPTPTTHFTDTHLNLCISSCILAPPHSPSLPCPVSGHILLFDASASYIMISGAISVCHFNCVRLEKYCHLGEGTFFTYTHPPPPPSLPQDEFLKSGAINYVI